MLDRNKQQMQKIVELFASGDIEAVDSLVGDDYLDHQGLYGNAETVSGQDGFRRVIEAARRFVPPRVYVEDLIAEGDRVVARLRWVWNQPAGHDERETIEIMRFRNGLAVEHWGARAE
jgi:predicted SnoaL-like aldol condensation-catalyzing enzyme